MNSIDKLGNARSPDAITMTSSSDARTSRARMVAQTPRPNLLLITLAGCLLVTFVLADAASHDSTFGVAVAFVLLLAVVGWLIRDLLRMTTDPINTESLEPTIDVDRPRATHEPR
jgi:hypothetical protein